MITQNIMFTPGDKQDYIEFDIVPDNQVEGIEFFTITAGIATAKIGIADTFGMGYIVGVVQGVERGEGPDEGGGRGLYVATDIIIPIPNTQSICTCQGVYSVLLCFKLCTLS